VVQYKRHESLADSNVCQSVCQSVCVFVCVRPTADSNVCQCVSVFVCQTCSCSFSDSMTLRVCSTELSLSNICLCSQSLWWIASSCSISVVWALESRLSASNLATDTVGRTLTDRLTDTNWAFTRYDHQTGPVTPTGRADKSDWLVGPTQATLDWSDRPV